MPKSFQMSSPSPSTLFFLSNFLKFFFCLYAPWIDHLLVFRSALVWFHPVLSFNCYGVPTRSCHKKRFSQKTFKMCSVESPWKVVHKIVKKQFTLIANLFLIFLKNCFFDQVSGLCLEQPLFNFVRSTWNCYHRYLEVFLRGTFGRFNFWCFHPHF